MKSPRKWLQRLIAAHELLFYDYVSGDPEPLGAGAKKVVFKLAPPVVTHETIKDRFPEAAISENHDSKSKFAFVELSGEDVKKFDKEYSAHNELKQRTPAEKKLYSYVEGAPRYLGNGGIQVEFLVRQDWVRDTVSQVFPKAMPCEDQQMLEAARIDTVEQPLVRYQDDLKNPELLVIQLTNPAEIKKFTDGYNEHLRKSGLKPAGTTALKLLLEQQEKRLNPSREKSAIAMSP